MNPQEREEAIIGPSVNAAAGPVGGYFPLQGGKPAFRDLNRLCTEEIPRPKSFVLVQKDRSFNGETFLGYYYQSTDDYESVKRFYKTYFAEHGWVLTKEKDSGWGPKSIEFHNEDHRVTFEE